MIERRDLSTMQVEDKVNENGVHDDELTIFIEPSLPKIKEGTYDFYVSNVGVENALDNYNRPTKKIVIEFILQRQEGVQVVEIPLKQRYTVSSKPLSWFSDAYSSLTGMQAVGTLNLKTLIGIRGICDIKHWEMPNGNVIPRVVNIVPNTGCEAVESDDLEEMVF